MQCQGALRQSYWLGRKVGTGARGTLRIGRSRKTGRTVMLEVFEADAPMLDQFSIEERAAEIVQHRCLVQPLERGRDERTAWVASERIHGKSLERLLRRRRRLRASQIETIIRQLIEVVGQLDRVKLVHGALDASQVILQKDARGQYRVRLLDFGVVRKVDKLFGSFADSSKKEAELSTRRGSQISRGINVDVRAIGELIWRCLPRRLPRDPRAREHQFARVAMLCLSEDTRVQPRNCEQLRQLWALASVRLETRAVERDWVHVALTAVLFVAFAIFLVAGLHQRGLLPGVGTWCGEQGVPQAGAPRAQEPPQSGSLP